MQIQLLPSDFYYFRDVACRNCLVNSHRLVKLGDFGMTRYMNEKEYYLGLDERDNAIEQIDNLFETYKMSLRPNNITFVGPSVIQFYIRE